MLKEKMLIGASFKVETSFLDKALINLTIEYGLFATEFRSKQNECYHCVTKIKANEINLLKIK